MVTVLNPPTPKESAPSASDVLVSEHEKRVEAELAQLLVDIRRIGSSPGSPYVLFGELFDDDKVQQYYEALVGTLKCAKKRGVVTFKGQILLKGIHDDVVISIVEKETVEEQPTTQMVDTRKDPPIDQTKASNTAANANETDISTKDKASKPKQGEHEKDASQAQTMRQSPQKFFTFYSRVTPTTYAMGSSEKRDLVSKDDDKSSPIGEKQKQEIAGTVSEGEAEVVTTRLYQALPPAGASCSDSEADGRTTRRGRVTLPPVFLCEESMSSLNVGTSGRPGFVHQKSMSSVAISGRPPAPSWKTRKAKSSLNVTKSPERSSRRASASTMSTNRIARKKESFIQVASDEKSNVDKMNVPAKPKLTVEASPGDDANESNEPAPVSSTSMICQKSMSSVNISGRPVAPSWKTRKAKSSLNVTKSPERSSRRASTSTIPTKRITRKKESFIQEINDGESNVDKKNVLVKPKLTVETAIEDDTNESNETTPISTPTSTKENMSENIESSEKIPSKAAKTTSLNRKNSLALSREVSMRVDSEVNQLMKDICRVGSNPGEPSVTFGELFDDEDVQNTYEALVGTLRSAKRQGYINFKGQMLFKGMHDDVTIHVTERHAEATA